jgi:hypothetical protein
VHGEVQELTKAPAKPTTTIAIPKPMSIRAPSFVAKIVLELRTRRYYNSLLFFCSAPIFRSWLNLENLPRYSNYYPAKIRQEKHMLILLFTEAELNMNVPVLVNSGW